MAKQFDNPAQLINTFYIGSYWRNRKENLETVITKSIEFLEKLEEIDPLFMKWYVRGMSKQNATKDRIILEYEYVENLINKRIKKGDLDNDGFCEIGFRLGGWSGHSNGEAADFSITSGGFSKFLLNTCILNLPYKEEVVLELLKFDKLKKLLRIFIETWKPDWAVVQSNKLMNLLDLSNKIGLITYFDKKFMVPEFNEPIRVEQIKDYGKIIYINKPLDPDNLKTIELIKHIKDKVEAASNII